MMSNNDDGRILQKFHDSKSKHYQQSGAPGEGGEGRGLENH